ncbi:MAG TPA: CoA transferase [Trueperaceae bacterium]
MDMHPPLEGVRVLDFSLAWAGPMATRILSFLGADVIKIEGPTKLDSWRGPLQGNYTERYPDHEFGDKPYNRNCYFNTQNHDKRSVGVNLKHPNARELMYRFLEVCNVVVANFSPGTMDKLGLGYPQLRSIRPDVIMVEMPAYGNTGPFSHYVGMGHNMEAMAGMPVLFGYGDSTPVLSGSAYLDPMGGYHAAAAIMTALIHRQRTGEGQYVEVPQRESAMHWEGEILLDYLDEGHFFVSNNNASPDAAPHDAYPCRGTDEWVVMAVGDDAQFRALASIMGLPHLANDERFSTMAARHANQHLLREPISRWSVNFDKHELARKLQAAGIPAAPVSNGKDVAHDPHLRDRGFFADLEHPEAGCHAYQGLPFRLSTTPGSMNEPAPRFGEDTKRVLHELLGLSTSEIAHLERIGVIATEPATGAGF